MSSGHEAVEALVNKKGQIIFVMIWPFGVEDKYKNSAPIKAVAVCPEGNEFVSELPKNWVINQTVDVENNPIFTTRTKLNYLIV